VALRSRNWLFAAVACQLACAAYLQLVEWVDLFPWNDLSKGNMQEKLDFVILAAQILIAFCFARGWVWLMGLGWAAYATWLYLQVDTWWRPYLFGGRTVGPNWYFAKTYKFLPQIDARPTPDANHTVLQLLLVVVLVAGAVAIWRTTSAARAATAGR
jgi:hypothetical protein